MHSLPLLWSSVGRLPPWSCAHWASCIFLCSLSENSFFGAEMNYGTQLEAWGSYWKTECNKASQYFSVLSACPLSVWWIDDCPQIQDGFSGSEYGISQFSQTFIGQTQHSVSLLCGVPGHRIVMQVVSIWPGWPGRDWSGVIGCSGKACREAFHECWMLFQWLLLVNYLVQMVVITQWLQWGRWGCGMSRSLQGSQDYVINSEAFQELLHAPAPPPPTIITTSPPPSLSL